MKTEYIEDIAQNEKRVCLLDMIDSYNSSFSLLYEEEFDGYQNLFDHVEKEYVPVAINMNALQGNISCMDNIEILQKVLKKLKPETWTMGAMAKDEYNNCVASIEKSACKWDIIGAIYSETVSFPATEKNEKFYEIIELLKQEVFKTLKSCSLSYLNDTLGLNPMIAIVRGAIKTEYGKI